MAEATSIDRLQIEIGASSRDAADQVDQLSKSLKNLKIALRNATKGPSKVSVDIDTKAVDAATKRVNSFKKLLSSIGRVAFYRAIRIAIKTITEGFKEGLENAYWFSKGINGDLANALDRMSSAGFKAKNQLGAALGQLLEIATPLLIRLIDILTSAANAVTQFFAVLAGKTTYMKAVDYWKKWGDAADDAGGKAKRALRYLAPFDELNVLPSNSGSGSGGSGSNTPDYENMFEMAEIGEFWQNLAAELKFNIEDVFFNWSDLSAESIWKKVVVGLSGLMGGIIGFAIGGPVGALVGTIAGVAIGLVVDSLVFNHDGKISSQEIQKLAKALTMFAGGLIGFAVGGPGGALIGAAVPVGIDMVLEALNLPSLGEFAESIWKWFANGWNTFMEKVKNSGFGQLLSRVIGIDFEKWKIVIPVDEEKTHGLFRRAAVDGLYKANNDLKDKPVHIGALVDKVKMSVPESEKPRVQCVGVIPKVTVTASTPVINVTGKMDRILKPGGGYIEIKGNGGVFANGGWKPITAYAGGGNPVGGELFLARESGPEMVGKLGGHTAVMNNNQIVASVSDGVAQANTMVVSAVYAAAAQIVNALREKELGGSGRLSLDMVAKELTRLQRNAARANG